MITISLFSSDKGHAPGNVTHDCCPKGGSVVSLNGFNGACSVRQKKKRAKMIKGGNCNTRQ